MAEDISSVAAIIATTSTSETTAKNILYTPTHGFRRRELIKKKGEEEDKIGYIYFLRTREFRMTGQPIYKLGKTCQPPDTRIRRLECYTKGSEIIALESCSQDCVNQIEKDILAQFRPRWCVGPDGSEDFIITTDADLREARDIIHRIVIASIPSIVHITHRD